MDEIQHLKRIGIVGSRNFGDLSRVSKFVEILHQRYGDRLVIVSGGAKGVDSAAEKAADELGIKKMIFLPRPGKPFHIAAMERNTEIVDYSHWVYAFWSVTKESTGTIDSMRKALLAGKLVGLYTPNGAFDNTRIPGPA
jgi:hypothetical protein